MTDRKATTSWKGDLKTGDGEVSFDSSGAAGPLEVSFPRRAEDPQGVTSPEELIAAAHSACFSMALSNALAKNDTPPEKLDTSAVATFSTEGGAHISKVALSVVGTVPGISQEDFVKAAEGAKDGCAVSKLMAGNTELTLDARLA